MSSAMQFYVSVILIYLGIDLIACWGLNLQYGVAGVVNLAFIAFQAVGAYTAAILSMGPAQPQGYQTYFIGASLPFPVPIICAVLVGGVLSGLVGLVALRRLRSDLQAIVLLVFSLVATDIATNQVGFLNGSAGLSQIPLPLESLLNLTPLDYQWFYVGLTAVACLLAFWVVRRLTGSPLGRAMRSVRDNEYAAAALGRNVFAMRMRALIVGGMIAAFSGALLVPIVGAWAPSSWLYGETLVLFAALLLGGRGNNLGVALGAVLVPGLFLEGTSFIHYTARPGFIDAVQWIVIGLLMLLVLWFRPQGLLPERPRRVDLAPSLLPPSRWPWLARNRLAERSELAGRPE